MTGNDPHRIRASLGLVVLLAARGVGCGEPPSENPPPPRCGDNVANTLGEECDGGDLRGVRCLDRGFTGGLLQCTSSCTFDDTQCSRPCGDGVADPGQPCDGADLGGQTCESLGHYRGTLQCTNGCTLDESGCERCGDGQVQSGDAEECDGDDLNGESCLGLGYYGGTLVCGGSCRLIPSDCVASGSCGAGELAPKDSSDIPAPTATAKRTRPSAARLTGRSAPPTITAAPWT